jgi:hypothetical protein
MAYVRDSWLAWLLVKAVTAIPLAVLMGRDRSDGRAPATVGGRGATLAMALDLAPMFVAATAIRVLLGSGLTLHGTFAERAIGRGVAELNGRTSFTAAELDTLRQLLRDKETADRGRQKALRQRMRYIG